MGIAFRWEADHFHDLMASARRDELVPYILRWLDKRGPVLEAGCGLGRFVAFMVENGFEEVRGVDISAEAVGIVNRLAPELDVAQADVSSLPFPDASMRGVLSLGVVEHFEDGPRAALQELRRVMMPGATAIVTVPYLNPVRRLKHALRLYELASATRRGSSPGPESSGPGHVVARSIAALPRDVSKAGRAGRGPFVRWPPRGPFFEYRFRRDEFARELRAAGLSIVHVAPLDAVSGMFYELGRPFVASAEGGRRTLTRLGRVVDRMSSPWLLAHMILFVVRRAEGA